MSPPQLSPQLKQLLAAPGTQAVDRARLAALFEAIRAQSEFARRARWLLVLTGALFALNAVQAIPELYRYARDGQLSDEDALFVVGRMREVGLKTISFMGVPRVRHVSREAWTVQRAGKQLWDDIYAVRRSSRSPYYHAPPPSYSNLPPHPPQPHHEKLLKRLADAHPDLPVHILQCHYSSLLATPVRGAVEDVHSATLSTAANTSSSSSTPGTTDLDRVENSIVAVTCLRALGGVEKQVESHVFGLRKAAAGSRTAEDEGDEWITSDAGCVWLLSAVDQIVHVFRHVRE
ncbi:hypothetical protein QFC19_002747 [Naganishia cerealis]|uniref:Uncharacterized protein n=1 Tax=Naganishia cerealis TaxID=610337 RepID=A0ACC2W8T9_9TREE|nr:hypothetical protein QFC19_002747 [Naganishia cerealis]